MTGVGNNVRGRRISASSDDGTMRKRDLMGKSFGKRPHDEGQNLFMYMKPPPIGAVCDPRGFCAMRIEVRKKVCSRLSKL